MSDIMLYMAPMEGLTVHTFRNNWNKYYGGADKMFTPFIAAEGSRKMKSREIRDILPENNQGIYLVPQIISNNVDNFIRFARLINERGYDEINLNLGCPSGTVVAKHKGSGFLGRPKLLDEFLYKVYSELSDMKVSVKTRIGLDNPEEIYGLLDIYNKYPIYELIVHPRIRTDYYRHDPRMEYFTYVYENSKNPVCYNGNIYNKEEYNRLITSYPQLTAVMLGRGLVRNPALIGIIRGTMDAADKNVLKEYHDNIYKEYRNTIDNERVVVYKMKEIWCYMLDLFEDDGTYKRLLHQADNLADYSVFAGRIFRECGLKDS